MLKKLTLAGAALATLGAAAVPVAADAQYYRGHGRGHYRTYDDGYYGRDARDYRGYSDYRARKKCKDGDGGTIIGAIAGGLLGRAIDTRGSRVTGTILGAAGGALAGRAIDRSDRPGYCR